MKRFLYVLLCVLIISPCAFFLSACGTPATYAVSVKTSDSRYGSVAGNGSFKENTTVTLSATPLQNANFLCWTLNNKVVSKDAEYTFKITGKTDGTYVALFDKALDYYALTEIALTFNEGVQIQELNLNIQTGSSLSSLQKIYDVTTNPVVRTQTHASVSGFYNRYLIHKKTTDTNFHCRLKAKATNTTDTRHYNEDFELDFDALYNDGTYVTEERTLSGYGTIRLTFKKLTAEIVNHMI